MSLDQNQIVTKQDGSKVGFQLKNYTGAFARLFVPRKGLTAPER